MMCLSTITDPEADPKAKGTGWKALVCHNGKLESPCFGPQKGAASWNLRTWRRAGNRTEVARHGDPDAARYRAGIHLFRTRATARAWAGGSGPIRKVEWQGLICRGTQREGDALVVECARLLEK